MLRHHCGAVRRPHATAAILAMVLCSSVSHTALAAGSCTTTDVPSGSLLCTGGVISTAITVYDAAAGVQPVNGSNSYTPASYNQTPPTTVITINSSASFAFVNPTTAQLADRGIIAANFSNAEDPAVNNVQIDNYGSISLSTNQIATSRMHALVGDSQVNTFTVNNYSGATISVTQTAIPGALTVTSSGSPATYSARQGGATLNIVSAMFSDDNTNAFVIDNASNASITATGSFAAAYYGRADTTITNNGLIGNTNWGSSDKLSAGHWSIVAYAGAEFDTLAGSNPDTPIYNVTTVGGVNKLIVTETASLNVTNNANATIKGDILAIDTNPLVTSAAGSQTGAPGNGFFNASTYAVSGSNSGPRDSAIMNAGTILGNIYLGNGGHTFDNQGSVTGSVYVDQTDKVGSFASNPIAGTAAGTYQSTGSGVDSLGNACPAAGANTTDLYCAKTVNVLAAFHGDRTFDFSNSGTFSGDIRINDVAGAVNTVSLTGTGFTGNVVAVNGTGNNSLSLDGVTTLTSVQNFTNLNLNSSNVTVSGGVSLVNGANIATTIYGSGGTLAAPSTNLGTINGTLTLAGATVISPTLTTAVHNGDVYQLASAVTGPGTGALSVDFTSGLVSLTADTSTGKLLLEATVANANTIAGLSAPGATTLNALLASTSSNPQVAAIQVAVANMSAADARKAGEQLRPETNGGSFQAPLEVSRLIFNEVNSHLLGSMGAPSGSPVSSQGQGFVAPSGLGMSPGLRSNLGATAEEATWEPRVKGAWVQGFGARIDQGSAAQVDGYSADIGGLMAGFDTRVSPGLRVGGGFAAASTTVNDNGLTSGNHQDITTYFGMLYASATSSSGYLNGLIGYGANDYTGSRSLSVGGLTDSAGQSHSGNQFMAALEAGAPRRLGFATVVPTASFRYVNVSQDAYAETSKGGMALNVGSQQADSAVSGLGLRAQIPLFAAAFSSAIEGRAMWLHEFGDVVQQTTASFVGGSPSFVAVGPGASRDLVDVSVGVKLASGASDASVVVGYDGAFRDGYTAHAGSLRARIGF